MKHVLAVDIGTSSCRSALFDELAQRVPDTMAQLTYRLTTDSDGRAELSPVALLREVKNCIRQTFGTQAGRFEVGGVGVSCFWHSLIGTDENGTPLTPIYTWADSRCRADAQRLRHSLDERTLHSSTGCMLRTSFWPAKLAWLRRTQPALFKKVRRWMSPAEWLQWELTGSTSCAVGMATATGLFNPAALDWAPELFPARFIDAKKLPSLSEAPSEGGKISARLHPSLSGTPWFPAIGDGAASNLGAGASRPGYAALNFGTSAAIRVMKSSGEVTAPFGLFCYRVDRERFLLGGAISNAGNLRAWALRVLRLEAHELEAALLNTPPLAHGLTALPFLTAERAPTWPEELEGVLMGLTQNTRASDIAIAMIEATFQRLAWIADLIPDSSRSKILVSGGIQASPALMQRLADALGKPLYPNDEAEASLRGAAVFALEKLGYAVPPASPTGKISPKPRNSRLFKRARPGLEVFEGAATSLWTNRD